MATTNQCIASLARLSLSATTRPTATPSLSRYLAPAVIQARWKSAGTTAMQAREREKEKAKRKRKQQRFKEYKYATPSKEEQHSLCDAMRYVEDRQSPHSWTCIWIVNYMLAKESPLKAYTHTSTNNCVCLDISEQLKSAAPHPLSPTSLPSKSAPSRTAPSFETEYDSPTPSRTTPVSASSARRTAVPCTKRGQVEL